MFNYNDLTRTTKRICIGTGLLALLLVAGCTATPQPHDAPTDATTTAVTPLPPSPPTQNQAISDATLRQAVRDNAPLRYVVKPGDTLWDIADYFMVKPWYWPELWYDNPEIDNPHLIYPGDVLILTHVNGRPRIKLSPRVREKPVHKPIPTIPAKAIQALLDAPRLVDEQRLKNAPYILGFKDQHVLAGERMTAFVRGLERDDPARLAIVRPQGPLTDPQTQKQIGFLALPIGQLEITRRGDGVATARITASERAARAGDRLLPARTRLQVSHFRLHTPEQPVSGQIIAAYGGATILGQYAVVVINRGARSGLERGHLLQIYAEPRTVEDPIKEETVTLPAQKIGLLMLFEVKEQTSLGIVLQATHAIHELDHVRTPATR